MPAFIAIVLGILFIAFKLTGVIAWSWVWVLAPFWVFFLAMIAFMVLGTLAVGAYVALMQWINS